MIDTDPIAACVRDLMSERSFWKVSAADLLRISNARAGQASTIGWPKTPRALAGRLRRAQTFLRAFGIDIAFAREGRSGSRVGPEYVITDRSMSAFQVQLGPIATVARPCRFDHSIELVVAAELVFAEYGDFDICRPAEA